MTQASEYINSPMGMAPPAAMLGAKFVGLTLNEWVLAGSAVLIVLQLVVLIRDKFYRPWKEKRDRSA